MPIATATPADVERSVSLPDSLRLIFQGETLTSVTWMMSIEGDSSEDLTSHESVHHARDGWLQCQSSLEDPYPTAANHQPEFRPWRRDLDFKRRPATLVRRLALPLG
ncbi:hypothetical protein SRHO_G00006940 [Serrasalmus rhombeus]